MIRLVWFGFFWGRALNPPGIVFASQHEHLMALSVARIHHGNNSR
jgi:hypothetical protein